MERNAAHAMSDAIDTLGDLWRTAAAAAPDVNLTEVLSCEQHGLAGICQGLLQAHETLPSTDELFIQWLDKLQARVAEAGDRLRGGAPEEGLAVLDQVSLALITYRATRRLRLQAIWQWSQLTPGGNGGQAAGPVQRHRQVYRTNGLPRFEFNWIEGWLLAGRNPLTALDVELLIWLGVTHVLDLREEWEWRHPRFGTEAVTALHTGGVKRLHLPVADTHAPTPAQFAEACAFLEDVRQQQGARVYVHCRAGWERTAAILAAYHARRHDLPWGEALRQLQQRRPTFRLWPEQAAAVEAWTGGIVGHRASLTIRAAGFGCSQRN